MNETAKITSPQNSVIHSTFSIERIYPHAPARVFFAHADQSMKRRWFAEGEGWSIDEYMLDFRLNGRFRGSVIRMVRKYGTTRPFTTLSWIDASCLPTEWRSDPSRSRSHSARLNCSPVPVERCWPTPSKARTSMTQADRRLEKKGLVGCSKSSRVNWRGPGNSLTL